MKKDLQIRLDQHGRVTLDDSEVEAMIAAEGVRPLAGGVDWNDLCNNDSDCGGTYNAHCANYPGLCGDSLNVECNPSYMIR